MTTQATVFIVDDDEAVLDSLGLLTKSVGIKSQLFRSAQDFLTTYSSEQAGCLLLDVRMPHMSGLELQEKLKELNSILPIIFISGHGDIDMAVKTVQLGAVDFIQKPFREQELLDKIQVAIERDANTRLQSNSKKLIQIRLDSLTERELEVLKLIVEGHANKVIAIDLEVSQRTVEHHRSNIMKKMQATSLALLVRMAVEVEY